jgi:hypothetical protein
VRAGRSRTSCVHHPGRESIEAVGPLRYCESCRDARQRTTRGAEIRAHPAGCFARFVGGERWVALESGGPAHWLAHELGVRAPSGRTRCAAGFAVHARDLLATRHTVSGGPPRPGDLWVDLDERDCGVVAAVAADPERGLAITIRHLGSAPARVCIEDFYFQLHGRGRFFR